MSHVFQLLSLLKWKQHLRDLASRNVESTRAELRDCDAQLQQVQARINELDRLRKQSSLGMIAMEHLRRAEQFRHALLEQSEAIQRNRAECNLRLHREEAELVAHQQSVQALEKLQSQHAHLQYEKGLRRDQQSIDAWSAHRHHRLG
jgi:flagellar biosynthesis chaperone FliJ